MAGEEIVESQTVDSPEAITLEEWQWAIVDFFVHGASVIGWQKSVGQIYGVLYASMKPLCLDEIMQILGISKGSGSQGLSFLKMLGAVRLVYVPGDRKDYYEAEGELKKLVAGFLQNQIVPHLESGRERLAHVKQLWESAGRPYGTRQKIDKLNAWMGRGRRALPIVTRMLGSD